MTDSKKRIALKPHINQIREWVDEGKTDEWIADALGTSASSVQSFRSRNDIYRRGAGTPGTGGGGREPISVFEGVLDHGERDGWGMWLDPAVADDPIWRSNWAGVESVTVKVAEDSIVLEIAGDTAEGIADPEGGSSPRLQETNVQESNGAAPDAGRAAGGVEPGTTEPESDRERGRVKWFDPEKGYGFLIRPTGEDLFVHHSEVMGDASALDAGGDVEYVVGRNDRGPNARDVRTVD